METLPGAVLPEQGKERIMINYIILGVSAAIYVGGWIHFNKEQIFEKVTDGLAACLYGWNQLIDMIPDNAVA